MKIGIISDIHSNLYSLMEAYVELEKEEVDTIVCLGDIVGYGPHPNEVISFIRRKRIISLMGTYDMAVLKNDFSFINESTINNFSMDFTRDELTKNNLYYLSNLPFEFKLEFNNFKLRFLHKNPYEDEKDICENILICGCTHLASENKIGKDKYILNPGSLGRPNGNNGNLTFGVLNVSDKFCEFKIMNVSLPFHKIEKDMKMMKFPEILINSYNV